MNLRQRSHAEKDVLIEKLIWVLRFFVGSFKNAYRNQEWHENFKRSKKILTDLEKEDRKWSSQL